VAAGGTGRSWEDLTVKGCNQTQTRANAPVVRSVTPQRVGVRRNGTAKLGQNCKTSTRRFESARRLCRRARECGPVRHSAPAGFRPALASRSRLCSNQSPGLACARASGSSPTLRQGRDDESAQLSPRNVTLVTAPRYCTLHHALRGWGGASVVPVMPSVPWRLPERRNVAAARCREGACWLPFQLDWL
jgi:hypothetical protein